MPAKRVDQLRALRHQHFARLVMHERRLVLQCAHAAKAHRRPCHRFADPGGVGRVVLLPTHIGFDIGRRHHPWVMAELNQLARPMMGQTAGFHTDKTLGQLRKEDQHVLAPKRLGDDHAAKGVDRMNLKNMLGQIEANSRDRRQIGDRLSHGRRSFRGLLNDNHLGIALNRARCRCGRRPPHHVREFYLSIALAAHNSRL